MIQTAEGMDKTWSRERWAVVVFLLLMLHFGIVFALGERTVWKAPIRSTRTLFRSIPTPLDDLTLAKMLAPDPTLLAKPGMESVSGPAWLATKENSPALPDWTETPRWMDLQPADVAAGFSRSLKSFDLLSDRATTALVPTETTLPLISFVPETPKDSSIEWQVEGPPRRLLKNPELPARSEPAALANSVVRILINPEGTVVSAVLLRRSGSADADHDALLVAKRLLFDPAISARPALQQSADLRFIWAPGPGTAASPTNAAPVPHAH